MAAAVVLAALLLGPVGASAAPGTGGGASAAVGADPAPEAVEPTDAAAPDTPVSDGSVTVSAAERTAVTEAAPAPAAAAAVVEQCDGPLVTDTVVSCAALAVNEKRTFTITTTAPDRLRIRLTGLYAQLADPSGAAVCSVGGPYGPSECAVSAVGRYTLSVTNTQPSAAGFTVGFTSVRTAACTGLTDADLAFGSAGLQAVLPAGSPGRCFGIDQPAGVQLRIAELTGNAVGNVYDAAGAPVPYCAFRYIYGSQPCTTQGPGPYRLFIDDEPAQEKTYRFRVTRISDPMGCAALPLAPYAAPPADAVAAGTLARGGMDCRAVDALAGQLQVVRTGGDVALRLRDRAGNVVCDAIGDTVCVVPAAGRYFLFIEGIGWGDASYALAVRSPASAVGCVPVATAFDGPATAGTITSVLQADCVTFDAAPGDRIITGRQGSVLTQVVNAAGLNACPSFTDSCALTGTGPYRVVTTGQPGGYKLQVRRVSDPVGCPVIEPQAFGANPSQSDVRCRLLHVPAAGRYFVGEVVRKADGTQLCSGWCDFPAEGTYFLLVGTQWEVVEGSRAVAFVRVDDGAACAQVPDGGVATPLANGVIGVQGQFDCLQLAVPQGTPLMLQRPSDGPALPTLTMVDAAGKYQCDWYALTDANCRPTGPAPYRVLVSGEPGPYSLAITRLSGLSGCAVATPDTFASDTGTAVAFDSTHALRCLELPGGKHGANELVQAARTSGKGQVSAVVVAADGGVACRISQMDRLLGQCALEPGKAYTLVLSGPASAADYRVVHRDYGATAVGCATQASTAIGTTSVSAALGSATDAKCVRFTAAVTDRVQVEMPRAQRGVVGLLVGGAATSGDCWWAGGCEVTGGTEYRAVLTPFGTAVPSEPARVDVWRTVTAAGNPAECPAVVSTAHGFGPLTGTFTPGTSAVCRVLPVKPGDVFSVVVANTGGGQQLPRPLVWYGNYPNQCLETGAAGTYQCTILSTWPVRDTALFVLQAPAGTADTAYRMTAVCATGLCGKDSVTAVSVAPNTAKTGTAVTLTVKGTALGPKDKVQLTRSGQSPIPATVTGSSGDWTALTATVDLSGAAVGVWNVTVTAENGTQVVLTGAFTVTAAAPTRADEMGKTPWDGTQGRTPVRRS